MSSISKLLDQLHLDKTGHYDNKCYIIPLASSDEYAKIYSRLNKYAVNTEYPNIQKNESNIITDVVNYFEATVDDKPYDLFLMADFINDVYKLKIKESQREA